MKFLSTKGYGRRRASAMLVVLWAMIIMAFAVVGFVEYMRVTIEKDAEEAKEFRARHLAESGIVLANHPLVRRGDPLLARVVSPVSSYEVQVTTEGARLAINHVHENIGIRRSVRSLFELWGIDVETGTMITDSLADWIDGDDKVRVLGAEEDFYIERGFPQYPRNALFRSLEELLLVRGMEEVVIRQPKWREYFTLYGDGKLDINEAGAELIEVVCEVDPEAAMRLVLDRRGPDEMEATWDDALFEGFDRVQELLLLGDDDFSRIEPRLTLRHPIRRIVSTGRVGNYEKTLVAILGGGHRDLIETQSSVSSEDLPIPEEESSAAAADEE